MRLIKCLASLILMAINLIGCSSRDSRQRDYPYTRSDSIAFYQDEIHKISKQQGHHHFELDYIQADTVQMDLLLQAYKDIKERLEDRLGFLNSIDEPDFSLLMDSIETYRLVYSFAFESGKYILVRVAATNDTYSLLMKEIAVLPGYDPEIGDSIWIPIITSEFHKGLSMEEWFQFKRLLSDSYFFWTFQFLSGCWV